MKRSLLFVVMVLVALLLSAGDSFADSTNISSRAISSTTWKAGEASYWLGGEHTYVQWKGSVSLAGDGDTDTTYWIQFSKLPSVLDSASFDKQYHYPRELTLDVTLRSAGDSSGLATIRPEYRWASPTTVAGKSIHMADSSDYWMVRDGSSVRADYQIWTYENEPDMDTANCEIHKYYKRYFVKVGAPGVLRLIFGTATTLNDAQTLEFILTGMY